MTIGTTPPFPIPRPNPHAPSASATLLWCCHVRGPDDVHPAPDYQSALLWADYINLLGWPRTENDPLMGATPALWPHDAASHASGLAESIEGFRPRDGRDLRELTNELRDRVFASLPGALPAPPSASATSGGAWKLTPRDATRLMCKAGEERNFDADMEDQIWTAMWDMAPDVPSPRPDATAEEEAARRYPSTSVLGYRRFIMEDMQNAFLAGSSFAHDRLAAEREEIVRVIEMALPLLESPALQPHPLKLSSGEEIRDATIDAVSSAARDLLARLRSASSEGATSDEADYDGDIDPAAVAEIQARADEYLSGETLVEHVAQAPVAEAGAAELSYDDDIDPKVVAEIQRRADRAMAAPTSPSPPEGAQSIFDREPQLALERFGPERSLRFIVEWFYKRNDIEPERAADLARRYFAAISTPPADTVAVPRAWLVSMRAAVKSQDYLLTANHAAEIDRLLQGGPK